MLRLKWLVFALMVWHGAADVRGQCGQFVTWRHL